MGERRFAFPSALRLRLRLRLRTMAKRIGSRLGLDVVDRSIYSPVPRVPSPDDELWGRRSAFAGIEFSTERQLDLLETELKPHIAEFEREVLVGAQFRLWNGLFQAGDAETLYAMLRWLKPRQVLELGSGYSTMVAAAAGAVNEREGHPVEITFCDPAPRARLESVTNVVRAGYADARDVPLDRFLTLAPGDVLFVDTSHSVKLGSEVNRLILEVLPSLAPGVVVHFHDIFLPYEYPRYLFEREGFFNEQYMLHAFLIENREWEIMIALAALHIEHPGRTKAALASLNRDPPGMPGLRYMPASFWMRKRDRGGSGSPPSAR